jgi:cytochrome c oxidase assembly protein subunit 15
MVASGLTGDAVYVKPTRLALHFIFALGLLSYCFWFALQLLVDKKEQVVQAPLRKWNMLILCLVVIQLLYGALMAGHKAATAASTWPTINGEWVPESVIKNGIGIRNFVDNSLLIHLIHRSLAYIIFVLIVLWTVKIRKTVVKSTLLTKTQWLPLVLVLVQVALGIISLVTSKYIKPGKWGAFEWAAQLHQLIGMTLLLSLIWMLFIIRGKSTTTG